MQKKVTQIKDFKTVLKDFEPMVKNPKFLHSGRDIPNFSLRPREAWANWLLCVVLNKLYGDIYTFAEDADGDGIIINKKTKVGLQTEHVSALEIPEGKKLPSGEQRVIDAINHKIAKGEEYARNKHLIVFFDGAGKYYRNKIREAIRGNHNFLGIFAVGLVSSDNNGYTYAVTEFLHDTSLTFEVKINNTFTDWSVSQVKG